MLAVCWLTAGMRSPSAELDKRLSLGAFRSGRNFDYIPCTFCAERFRFGRNLIMHFSSSVRVASGQDFDETIGIERNPNETL